MAKKRRHHHSPKREDNYIPNAPKEVLDTPITQLDLTEFSLNILTDAGILTVMDICKRTERDMFKVQRFGKRNLEDVRRAITKLGVSFKEDTYLADKKKEEHSTNPTTSPISATSNEQPKKDKKKKEKPSRPTSPGEPEEWVKFNRVNKWGIKDLMGKERIPAEYDEIFLIKEGLACFEKLGSFGYIDVDNNIVIEPQYECAMSFSEGLACVTEVGGKTGYINRDGEVVIPFEYDAGTAFREGIARVKKDGRWAKITVDGELNWEK